MKNQTRNNILRGSNNTSFVEATTHPPPWKQQYIHPPCAVIKIILTKAATHDGCMANNIWDSIVMMMYSIVDDVNDVGDDDS